MKLEKVNDNQIRCTLSKEDLQTRGIKISEIAYGSMKAKMLFKDVMQQASYEFGFEAENIPLMIEAIPMSTGCIVFIITKVENPEELDTRYSRFAPSINDNEDLEESDCDEDDNQSGLQISGTDIFSNTDKSESIERSKDLFSEIAAQTNEISRLLQNKKRSNASDMTSPVKVFVFDSLENVGKAAKVLAPSYEGNSSLYKNTDDNTFHLILERGFCEKKEFLKIGNLLLEYGSYKKTTDASIAFMKEHYKLIIDKDAVAGMAKF